MIKKENNVQARDIERTNGRTNERTTGKKNFNGKRNEKTKKNAEKKWIKINDKQIEIKVWQKIIFA